MLKIADYLKERSQILPYLKAIDSTLTTTDLIGQLDSAFAVGVASLFVDKEGFVILRPFVNDSTKVLVWVAQSFRKVDLTEHQSRIDQLARQINARELEFWSIRKGFNRVAPTLGWVKSHHDDEFMVWRKKL